MTSSDVHLIESDIEATRKRLSSTIDRIQDKLTVTGIVDEVMGQAGVPRFESGHDFVLGFLRRHPVPVMVVAAGIGWLMYRRSRALALDDGLGEPDIIPVLSAQRVGDVPSASYDPVLPALPGRMTSVPGRPAPPDPGTIV